MSGIFGIRNISDIRSAARRAYEQLELKPSEELLLLTTTATWGVCLAVLLSTDATALQLLVLCFITAGSSAYLKWKGQSALLQCVLAGLTLAFFSMAINGPKSATIQIKDEMFADLAGTVERIERPPGRPVRIWLSEDRLSREAFGEPSIQMRLSARTHVPELLLPGDRIEVNALLQPPNGAAVPGGYNFGTAASYEGVEISGFTISSVEIVEKVPSSRLSHQLLAVRYMLADKIRALMSDEQAAIANALLLGLRGDIDTETRRTIRDSGISHLLAISGLHMGLVAGICFLVFEIMFAAIPAIALRIMPRKLATVPVWLTCFAYLLLSGAATATVRAFVMVSVALLAVLLDRKVFTIRSVLIAATVILFLWPHSVVSVSFQLSFAATIGLVLYYNRFTQNSSARGKPFAARMLHYLYLVGMTSAVSQVAIAPFALYHFQALSIVGILTNVIVIPIVSFLLMPLLLLLLLSLFVGGSAYLAIPIGFLISVVLGISDYLADVPLAVLRVQQIPDTSFLLLLLACLLLLVARFNGREVCIGLTCIGAFGVYLASDTAEVLISKSGSTIATHIDGELRVSGGRADSFRARAWRQYWAKPENNMDGSIEFVRSGPNGRFQVGDNRYITHADTISAVREGCSAGDIVILPRRYNRYCKGSVVTITFEQLKKEGPLGIKQPLTSKPVLIWANPPN